VKVAQNFVIGRGEERSIPFLVSGAAGSTHASWYAAKGPGTAVPHDLDLSSDDGSITFQNVGTDCIVYLNFTASLSQSLPTGVRWHELWVTVAGQSARRATGLLTVQDTLRS
jgi:hypothetical protein